MAQMAANLIDAITGELPTEQPEGGKNPAAVALGRLGGLKGERPAQLNCPKKTAGDRQKGRTRQMEGKAALGLRHWELLPGPPSFVAA